MHLLNIRLSYLTCCCVLLCAPFALSAQDQAAADPVTVERAKSLRLAIVGPWSSPVGDAQLRLRLETDGAYSLGQSRGTWEVDSATLILDQESGSRTVYQVKLPVVNNVSGEILELSGAGLTGAIVFNREREISDLLVGSFQLAPEELVASGSRLAVVLSICGLAWVVIRLLQISSRFVIYSNWGPLRYVYRNHKQRSATLHSLALNVLKYVVYFTALGLILTEFGVNYTAYLASLSVVGLAIGFGSQGLVQDMVTGFFVIFENQYDVGDMVEISGQTGIVEELGLRMTQIRNYLGQGVVIPNRNIATVGRFTLGAQHVTVDVAVGEGQEGAVSDAVATTAEAVAAEFPGVILSETSLETLPVLATGERFVRLQFDIWPQQTWVVDQQIIPRLRESFTRSALSIPSDRIVPFYHHRATRPAGWHGWPTTGDDAHDR